jgi:hypothetical protein
MGGNEELALLVDVHAAPPLIGAFGFEQRPFVALAGGEEISAESRFDAGTASFLVQIAAGLQDAIAQDFGFHAEEAVARTFQSGF